MPSFREIKATRLAFYMDRLHHLDACAQSMHTDLDDALAALSRAQDAVSALRAGIEEIQGERAQVEGHIAEINRQMDPAIMRALPTELLLAIFREMTSISSTWNCYQHFLGPYDRDRATAPWTLSAVCRRWRHLALDAPPLRTYVALSGQRLSQEAFHTCLYLERSRHLPLDISVQWTLLKYDAEMQDPILDTIADASHRWRSMQSAIPYYARLTARLDMFRRSTPLLEELIVHADGMAWNWHDDFPQYLPDCPRLRTMDTDGCHIVWTPPRSALLLLTRLELNVNLPAHVIWNMLLLAPQLEFLDLKQFDDPFDFEETQGPPSPLTLQKLTHLYLRVWGVDVLTAWPGLLRLPALATLAIMDSSFEQLPVLVEAADEITTLEISNEFVKTDDLAVLAALNKLQHLVICDSSDISIPPAIFEEIDRTHVWPRLESVKFSGGRLCNDAAEVLLRLVRARNLPVNADSNSARLREVIFEDASVPRWLNAQLALVL